MKRMRDLRTEWYSDVDAHHVSYDGARARCSSQEDMIRINEAQLEEACLMEEVYSQVLKDIECNQCEAVSMGTRSKVCQVEKETYAQEEAKPRCEVLPGTRTLRSNTTCLNKDRLYEVCGTYLCCNAVSEKDEKPQLMSMNYI